MSPPLAAAAGVVAVTLEPIDPAQLLASVGSPACGAVASFLGSVRSPNRGQPVLHIDYEGYEAMMVAEMERLVQDLRARFEVGPVAIAHRLGRLRPGEIGLAVAVASAHRGAALEACADLVESLKTRLPVWKYEVGPERSSFVEGRTEAGPTL